MDQYDNPPEEISALSPYTTDAGRYLRITVPLPGVAEEQIRIDLESTLCRINVSGCEKIQKTIPIPKGTRFVKKKFSDEVLEILLEKPRINDDPSR